MNYIIVTGYVFKEEKRNYLDDNVNEKIQEGYKPLGGPFVIYSNINFFGQAMIQEEKLDS